MPKESIKTLNIKKTAVADFDGPGKSFDSLSFVDVTENDTSLDVEYLAELCSKSESGTSDINAESDIILVVGGTGAGKSTFLQCMSGHKIEAHWNDMFENVEYKLVGDGEEFLKIGHDGKSMTSTIRAIHCKETQVYFVDTPGFNDNRRIEIDIATSLGIRNICNKAKRIRFVVLINAYSFMINRANELRSTLDHVQEFIGDNFRAHRKSFTFLFTHCSNAFKKLSRNDYMTLTDEEKNSLLKHAEKELYHNLEKSLEGTTDESLITLVNNLMSSIRKNNPDCGIFDPVISDITETKKQLLPDFGSDSRKKRFIDGKKKIIRINMTRDSSVLLEKELSSKEKILIHYFENEFTDQDSEESKSEHRNQALVMCKLLHYVDIPVCRESTLEILKTVQKVSSSKKWAISQALSYLSDEESFTEFSEDIAEKSRDNIEHIKYLDSVQEDCVQYLEENVPDFIDKEKFKIEKDVASILFDGVKLVFRGLEENIRSIDGHIIANHSNEAELNSNPISLSNISKTISKLYPWSLSFPHVIGSQYRNCTKNISSTLKNTCSLIVTHIDGSTDIFGSGYVAVKGICFLDDIQHSGILENLNDVEDEDMNTKSLCNLQKEIELCRNSIQKIPKEVYNIIRSIFDERKEVFGIKDELTDAFLQVLLMDKYLAENQSSHYLDEFNILKQCTSIAQDEMDSESMTIIDLIDKEVGKNDYTYAIRSRLQGTRILSKSIPKSVPFSDGIRSTNEDLLKKLESKVSSLVENLGILVSSLPTGLRNTEIDNHNNYLTLMRQYIWLDNILEEEAFLSDRFVEEKYNYFIKLYENSAASFINQTNTSLQKLLKNTDMDDGEIQEKASIISSSIHNGENLIALLEFQERNNKKNIDEIRKSISGWSNSTRSPVISLSTDKDNLFEIHRVYFISILLSKDNQTDTLEVFSEIKSEYSSILLSFSKDINNVMENSGNFEDKAQILEFAAVWTSLSTLSSHLPSYNALQHMLKKEISDYGEKLFKDIEGADPDNLATVSEGIAFLDSAQSHVDVHVDADASKWKATCNLAYEKRSSELDETFTILVEQKEYEQIAKHLAKLKSNPRTSVQYMKSINVLRGDIKNTVDEIQSLLSSSDAIERRGEEEVIKRWKDVLKAEKCYSEIIDSFSNWGVMSDLEQIEKSASEHRFSTYKTSEKALKSYDIDETDKAIKESALFHSLLQSISEFYDGNFNVEESSTQLEVSKNKFTALQQEINQAIENYINSLHNGEFVKEKEKESGGIFGQLFKKKEERKEVKPIDLVKILNNANAAADRNNSLAETKEFYENSKKKLSQGIENMLIVLKADYEKGFYSRPVKSLNLLGEELNGKGMNRHVEVEVDLITEMETVRAKKFETTAFDNFDETRVHAVANIVDQLSVSEDLFHKEDYVEYKTIINTKLNGMKEELYSRMNRFSMQRCFRRFVVFQAIDSRLRGHIDGVPGMSAEIVIKFESCLQAASDELSASLKSRNMGRLTELFHEFHILFFESFFIAETLPITEKDKMLSNLIRSINLAQNNLHSNLYSLIAEELDNFNDMVWNADFSSARSSATFIDRIGFFLCSSFNFYGSEVVSNPNGTDFSKIIGIINEKFSHDDYLDFAKNLAVLRLSHDFTAQDLAKSSKKQKAIWNITKYPLDKIISDRRLESVEIATEFLSSLGPSTKYHDYDFLFLISAASSIPKIASTLTQAALERDDYDKIKYLSEQVGDMVAFSKLCNKTTRENMIEENQISRIFFDSVKTQSDKLRAEIERACEDQDFLSLHHSFTALEKLENSFRSNPEIVPERVTTQVLLTLKENIVDMRESLTRFADKTQDEANEQLKEFARELVKMGRFLDGFPKLKSEAKLGINTVLERISKKPWGYSFIIDLGRCLETVDLDLELDDDERVARVLVGSFRFFQDIQNKVRRERMDKTRNVDSSLSETTSFLIDSEFRKKPLKFNSDNLSKAWTTYDDHWDDMFKKNVSEGKKGALKVVRLVLKKLPELKKADLNNWNRERNFIPFLLAGIFAVFSIMKCGDSYNNLIASSSKETKESNGTKDRIDPMDIVIRPHNIQVIAIFKLLGLGNENRNIRSHVMEVRTGEGKSIILGGLSILLSILGFSVRCVCYSQHLSERDSDLFQEVFTLFGVRDRITYSTIKNMVENQLENICDVRQLTVDMFNGTLDKSQNHSSSYSKLARASFEGIRQSLERKSEDDHDFHINESCLTLNGKEILLVDEIDVFFGPEFFGQTHNPSVPIYDESIEKLLRKIWKERDRTNIRDIKQSQEYKSVVSRFRWARFYFDKEIGNMIGDAQNFNDPPYKVNHIKAEIGYAFKDSVDFKSRLRYRTTFAYLHEYEKGSFHGSQQAEENLRKNLSLWILCTKLSYGNIKADCILGVSGTLKYITDEERKVIADFGIDSYSFLPSVYGNKKLFTDNGIQLATDETTHKRMIARQISKHLSEERGVLIFFEDDQKLDDFVDSDYWTQFKRSNLLTSSSSKDERTYAIQRAATCNQVTFSTAPFGRGTDFFSTDKKLETKGGLHVIQTFFSLERSEEIQIMGRTARQGQQGSYEMILCEWHLMELFSGMSEISGSTTGQELYKLLDRHRQAAYNSRLSTIRGKVQKSKAADAISREYLEALKAGNQRQARRLFTDLFNSESYRN